MSANSRNQLSDLYIGLMSGTSLDGVDAVLADFSLHPPRILSNHHLPYSEHLRSRLLGLSLEPAIPVAEFGETGIELGQVYAEASSQLMQKYGAVAEDIAAIGCHGQTIRHQPNGKHPFTLQIGEPTVVAERTGIATVAQFRQRDMAAGGQGAPLVPTFHQFLFEDPAQNRIVLNLGGIANISCLSSDHHTLLGFDTGPANVLIDGWCQRHLGLAYDKNGDLARRGKLIAPLFQDLQAQPYFELPPPKSTGRELFNLKWLDFHVQKLATTPTHEDVLYTLTELTAWSVAKGVRASQNETAMLIACGGGSYNGFLLERLGAYLPGTQILTSNDFGIRPDLIEALAFAWLARQTLRGLPGNHPAVTGAKGFRILGAIYPGR